MLINPGTGKDVEVNLLVKTKSGQLTVSLGLNYPRMIMLSIKAGGCMCQCDKQRGTLSALIVTHVFPLVISK